MFVLDVGGLDRLISALRARGFTVLGPTVRDGVVAHAEIRRVADLPAGVGDVQEPGGYRLRTREDGALFGFAAGPHSWKAQLFPSRRLLWRGRRVDRGNTVEPPVDDAPALALLGVRSCDVHAIAIHDTVLAGRAVADEDYAARRAKVFVVAVACGTPAGTCFCASMGTGPRPREGFDLALVELLDDAGHRFLVEAGSAAGEDLLTELAPDTADPADIAAAAAVEADAASHMGRTLDGDGLKDLLYDNLEHPVWEQVAQRCLACGNCTLACPTCFCTSVEDVTDLSGEHAERWRVWDSCFTEDFSYIHGGTIRSSTASRYRQWMTHKLASWQDQFGTSGCVGCGRCLTWCPAAIDITAEVAAIRATTQTRAPQTQAASTHAGGR